MSKNLFEYQSDLEQIGGILDQLEMIDARRVENVDINWHGSIVAEVETFDGLRGKVETVLKKNVHWLRVSFEAVTRAALPEVKALSKRSLNWIYIVPKYEIVHISRSVRDLVVPDVKS